VLPKRTEIEVCGRTVEVWYLMTEQDGKSESENANRDVKGPISSGMEAKWRERANREEAKKSGTGRLAMGRMKDWSEIADEYWPKACMDVVAGLHQCHAFSVIPSSRDNRRKPLVDALHTRFPAAIELAYTRPPGVRFGRTEMDEIAIYTALSRTDRATLPSGACVAIADDWATGWTTLRATICRIQADHRGCIGSFVCTVPGIAAVP